MRVGIGVDAHRFADGRRLILGGVELNAARGLLGHSDADVLSHAVADCLLGGAGLGDLGSHFPDASPSWKDVSSLSLLERVAEMLKEKNLNVAFVDATVICEKPKIASHRIEMQKNIARALGIPSERVNVKGTTTEGMGFEGRGEGISAWAVGLLSEATDK